jgi:hypothetical protein
MSRALLLGAQWKSVAALSAIPVCLFLLSLALRDLRGPYYLASNSDPDYPYLFNSLSILHQQAPILMEHPGTPVQLLGALAILARWLPSRLGSGSTTVDEAVLADPEGYLSTISVLLAILITASTFVAGIQALRMFGSLVPAMAIQLSLLLFTQVASALPKVSPEPLLIVAGLALTTALVPLVAESDNAGKNRVLLPIFVGAILGFGIATKFTFAPLLGFILMFHGWGKRVIALVASALAFVIFTLPIVSRYEFVVGWVQKLATHQGIYGSGDTGLPDASTLISNLGVLASAAAPLFVQLGLYALLLIVLSVSHLGLAAAERGTIRRLLLIGCLVLMAQIAITTKQPFGHYLLPSMVMCGLLNAAAVVLSRRVTERRRLSALGPAFAAAALVIGVVVAVGRDYDHAAAARANADTASELIRQIEAKNAVVVSYFGSSQLEYALAFGNDYARRAYNDKLRDLYPQALFYDIWQEKFYSFAGPVPDEEVTRTLDTGRTVLMYGLPFVGSYAQYERRLVTEPLPIGARTIYRLVRIAASGSGSESR